MCSYIFSIDILYPITVFEGESGFGEDEKKSAFFFTKSSRNYLPIGLR